MFAYCCGCSYDCLVLCNVLIGVVCFIIVLGGRLLVCCVVCFVCVLCFVCVIVLVFGCLMYCCCVFLCCVLRVCFGVLSGIV